MVERRVYRVNYGYRALIDWAPTARVQSSNAGLVGGTGNSLDRNHSSTLRGPYVYGGNRPEKGRPLESQISSSNIPGHQGLFWDIYYWDRPSVVASKGKSITRDDALRNMDTLAQQWIYLAAEHGNIHMNETMDAMNMPEKERENITKFFGSEEGDLGRMGESMWAGTAEEGGHKGYPNMFRNISDTTRTNLPWHVDAPRGLGNIVDFDYETIQVVSKTGKKSRKRVRKDYRTSHMDPSKQFYDDPQSRHYYTNQTPQVQPETLPLQLRKMVQGATDRKSWLSQWSISLQNSGVEGVEAMHKIVSDFVGKEWNDGKLTEEEYDTIVGVDDPKIYEDEGPLPSGQSYGATIQERLVVAAKLGISPSDAEVPRWLAQSISKPIDVQLHDPVQVGGLHIKNLDLTTSVYQAKTGHHGTPTSISDLVTAADNVDELATAIWVDYNESGGLIDKYNNVIDLLMNSALATTKTGKARGPKAVREKVLSESQRVGQIKNIAQASNRVDNEAANGILAMTDDDLAASITWALHYMGQSDTFGMAGEDFGNLMRVTIPDGKGGTTTGTLIVAFDIVDGRFSEAHVEIESGILPIEWLYNLLDEDRRNEISLPELVEISNAGHATLALEGTVVEGVFAKFAAVGTANFQPRIAWAKVSSSKLSKVLESVTAYIFDHIREYQISNLETALHKEAVSFSKAAREPQNLGAIPQWYRYAFREMIGDEAPPLNNDPFWYLWAAPYISTEWPQFGGGKQQNIDL